MCSTHLCSCVFACEHAAKDITFTKAGITVWFTARLKQVCIDISTIMSVELGKWKRKHSDVDEKPSLSPLGECLLDLFSSGTSVKTLVHLKHLLVEHAFFVCMV